MSPSIPSHLLPLLEQFSPDIREKIIAGWSTPRGIISFRVNYLRSSDDEVVQALAEAGLPYQTSPTLPSAYYLPKEHEYALRGLDIYTSGKIYVQSLTSMIPPLCMDLQSGQKILDMTASPGSKTTQIASILRGKCEITALEKFGIRYEKLLHTIRSQGAEKCVKVLKIDAIDCSPLLRGVVGNTGGLRCDLHLPCPTDFPHSITNTNATLLAKAIPPSQGGMATTPSPFGGGSGWRPFDRILIDAPCSSDGRIQLSDERTYRWYSTEKSKSKSLLQYEMLEQARKLLAPGGKIVYSTCSVSKTENEEVIQKFLKTHSDFHLLPCPITPDYTLEENMNRWFPSAMMEGFFVGVLEKIFPMPDSNPRSGIGKNTYGVK